MLTSSPTRALLALLTNLQLRPLRPPAKIVCLVVTRQTTAAKCVWPAYLALLLSLANPVATFAPPAPLPSLPPQLSALLALLLVLRAVPTLTPLLCNPLLVLHALKARLLVHLRRFVLPAPLALARVSLKTPAALALLASSLRQPVSLIVQPAVLASIRTRLLLIALIALPVPTKIRLPSLSVWPALLGRTPPDSVRRPVLPALRVPFRLVQAKALARAASQVATPTARLHARLPLLVRTLLALVCLLPPPALPAAFPPTTRSPVLCAPPALFPPLLARLVVTHVPLVTLPASLV